MLLAVKAKKKECSTGAMTLATLLLTAFNFKDACPLDLDLLGGDGGAIHGLTCTPCLLGTHQASGGEEISDNLCGSSFAGSARRSKAILLEDSRRAGRTPTRLHDTSYSGKKKKKHPLSTLAAEEARAHR